MDYSFDVDEQRRRFIITTQGEIEYASERNMLAEIFAHPEWSSNYDLLFDHSASTLEHLTAGDIQKLSDLITEYSDAFGDNRMAIVLSTELNYGLGRMWQAYSASLMVCEICIFKTLDEAHAWLDN